MDIASFLSENNHFPGAGSGIGKATCQLLAKEGAKVIATDCNLKTVEDTLTLLSAVTNDLHLALELNVGSSDSVNNALQKVLDHYKQPPSVVVNCAGITRDNFLLKMSEADFDEVINVNLKVNLRTVNRCMLHVYNILI